MWGGDRGRSDIEDHQFVGAFGVVARGKRSGIAGIAESHEIDAFDHARTVGVEAGMMRRARLMTDASCGQAHEIVQQACAGCALFSG